VVHVGETATAPSRPVPNGRVVRRRSSLPGGRALIGGLLVTAAGVGLFAAYQRAAAGPQRAYVIARHDVTMGTRLQRDDLAMVRMDLAPAVRGRAFANADVLVGATILGPLAGGELVQRGAVTRSTGAATDREVTVPIERTRVVSGLRDGERVDVLVTYGTGADAYTVTAVRQAVVVRVDRSRTSLGDSSVVLVTLTLSRSNDVLAVAHGSRAGQLTLARATGAQSGNDATTYRSPQATPTPSSSP
jgi:Flp pilus assembly protein CpaB